MRLLESRWIAPGLLASSLIVGGCASQAPSAPVAPEQATARTSVTVSMRSSGFAIDGTTVVSAQAVADELGARNVDTPIAVRIETPESTPVGDVADLLDRLRAKGIIDIAIVTLSAGSTPAPVASSSAPPADTEPPEPTPPPPPPPKDVESLPEVVVKNIGLHVGGGSNTDAEKAPFKEAVEKHFDELRACYKQVEDPLKGGIFGVDLKIGRSGGHPDVSQPRTSMKGQAFRDCVIGVFKSVEFDKPPKGPTVISYSVRFSAK
ncbi:MAG: hypothetical protein H6718_17660 [Polyangiaceae bacterium]|nr:hypothetical protein [Polyangiaceae bacterium]MCB9609387.1 hypothetical protein [Polyangiaceae bacterium]